MEIIAKRLKFSVEKIEILTNEILKLPNIGKFKDSICIYATGSFARGEASEYSDIDIFLLSKNYKTQNLDEIILKADLIRLIERLGLPEFSGDGEFLVIHSIEDIIENLGTKHDDYNNYFTARLLLLLESKPLFNLELYNEAVIEILKVYFNDYEHHEESFAPIFLANDIIRFWKTMCLNYEEKKIKRTGDEVSKNKSRLKNLKLKFSRITTCYSILCCLKQGKETTLENVQELIMKSPIERLLHIKSIYGSTVDIVDRMLELYEWFLEETGKEVKDVYNWIGIKENKENAFKNASEFHDLFYKLIEQTSKDLLKYYTI
ncbi:MAG TPA: nucleotidyltransferase domain-containing protein [Mucilaginibacter sp.]|nr:nucleotidyltransferase domain-containing protein [Mucilaginibacter sp.]